MIYVSSVNSAGVIQSISPSQYCANPPYKATAKSAACSFSRFHQKKSGKTKLYHTTSITYKLLFTSIRRINIPHRRSILVLKIFLRFLHYILFLIFLKHIYIPFCLIQFQYSFFRICEQPLLLCRNP